MIGREEGPNNLMSVQWAVLIADEGHKLKNKNSRISLMMENIQRGHTILLTGTPVQNNMEELFSLLHFSSRNNFPSEADFMKEYGVLSSSGQVLFSLPSLSYSFSPSLSLSLPPSLSLSLSLSDTFFILFISSPFI